MTREEYCAKITEQINLRLGVPGLNESQEAVVIEFVVWQVVKLLDDEQLQLMLDAANGLSVEEINRFAGLLAKVLNRYVDLPFCPDSYEETVIQQVVAAVLSFAAEGLSLTEAVAE